MALVPEKLRCIPLLRDLSNDKLEQLASVFKQQKLAAGETLFEEGRLAAAAYLLLDGEITIYEGEVVRMNLSPPACIGELGMLSGMTRNTTAKIHKDAEIWQVSRKDLTGFFKTHIDIALPFYQSLVDSLAHKVRRDQIRLGDMRTNIIRTQKAMKAMREKLLDAAETPFSENLHNTLDEMIRYNRRVNYRVQPPETLASFIRMDDGTMVEVVQISRTHVSFSLDDEDLPPTGKVWTGVLCLSGPEIPISGSVLRTVGLRVDLELDLLMDEYSQILDGYLTRVQMLNFMV